MLNDQQKAQIRRHMGYPAIGNPVNSPAAAGTLSTGFQGFRFFNVYGQLEYKMNWLSATEEAILVGLSFGAVVVTQAPNSTIISGLDLALRIINGDADETVTYTTVDGDTIYSASLGLANTIMSNAALIASGVNAVSPLSTGAFSQAAKPPATVQPFPGVAIQSVSPFQLVLTQVDTPLLAAIQAGSGQPQQPILDLEDGNTYSGYLQILNVLDTRIGTSSDNLDTSKADVWTARADEVPARVGLYNIWRQKMADFLGQPLWEDTPYARGGAAMSRDGGMVA